MILKSMQKKLLRILSIEHDGEDLVDAISIKGGSTNLLGKSRMISSIEWPYPGRGKWVLDKLEVQAQIIHNLGFYQSLLFQSKYYYAETKPPVFARKLPKYFMYCYILYRFGIQPKLSKIKKFLQ